MELQKPSRVSMRFGPFYADLLTGELFKGGSKVRLPEQPFRILAVLLERPGVLISREELRNRIWPADTHVDFDRSLNTAIRTLRKALGDTAESPTYVETIPKRGYRFIYADENTPTTASEGWIARASDPRRASRRVWALAAAGTGLLAIGVVFESTRAPALVTVTASTRVTNDDYGKSPEVATDGARVYFSAWKGGRGSLAQVAARGGDTELMPTTAIGADTSACVRSLSRDGHELLVVTGRQRNTRQGYALWSTSIPALTNRRMDAIVANDADWSPDGRRIAYATLNEIWVAHRDGTNARKITSEGGLTGYPRWSPDGKRIRFTTLSWGTYEQSIWEVSAEGGAAHPVFPDWKTEQWGGAWAPDSDQYFFNSNGEIWAVRDTVNWWTRRIKPVQLTFGLLSFLAPTPGPGRRIFAVGEVRHGELLQLDSKRQQFTPWLPAMSADALDFSKDGQWVTYTSYPADELWRSRVDGSERVQLTAAPMKVEGPRWSPDGKHIIVSGRWPGRVWKAYLLNAEGGAPKELPSGRMVLRDPVWSPDGNAVAVTSRLGQEPSISVFDFHSGKLTPMRGGKGMSGPAWSPDGRFIAATRSRDFACMLFDAGQQEWAKIDSAPCWWANWTHDSSSFFAMEGKSEAIRRFDIKRRRFERVVSLKDYRITGNFLSWPGRAPDDSPLVLRDSGSQQIYALDWQTH